MAEMTILFNDSFSAERWSPTAATIGHWGGLTAAQVMGRLTDGRLDTQAVWNAGVAERMAFFQDDQVVRPQFDTVAFIRSEGLEARRLALYNPTTLTDEFPVGAGESAFVGGNDLFRWDEAFADFAQFGGLNKAGTPGYIIRTNEIAANVPAKVALIYVGNQHRVTAYYPRGWRPPAFAEWEDNLAISNDGFPLGRSLRRKPSMVDLPLRVLRESYVMGDLQELIARMHREMFVLRFADGATWRGLVGYCMLERAEQPRYDGAGYLSATLKLRGYFHYA